MSEPGTLALLTDFGTKDPFIGMMKGVVLTLAPGTRIVDLTHEVPPQNLQVAAFYLMASVPYFPKGTLFAVVVDPGVGTERKIIWARTPSHQFLAPDNGVLSWVEEREPIQEVRWVANKDLFLSQISHTFHGRDMVAPAAAHLLNGTPPEDLGPKQEMYKKLAFPRARREGGRLHGVVLALDRFGNAITNIPASDTGGAKRVLFKEREVGPIKPTYSHVGEGEPVAVLGSFGFLELAVRKGSFARTFEAGEGDPVSVE